MKTQTIKLENKTLEIKKLPLRKYAELLKALQKLPKYFEQISHTPNNELLALLPNLIAECMDDVIAIVTIATPLTVEEVNELGMDELVDILLAVFEVNNYAKIYEKIKKVIPQQAKTDQLNG